MFKKNLLNYLLGFLIVTILWFIFYLIIDSAAIVSPLVVYKDLIFNFNSDFIMHSIASLRRIFISVALTMLIGSLFGILIGYVDSLNRYLDPIIYFLYPIPKVALLPVIMSLQGLQDASKITLIVLIAVFQVIIYIRDSIKCIPKQAYYSLTSLGASHFKKLYYLVLPSTKAAFFSSLRITVATAFSILFIVEGYGTTRGLGFFIQDAWTRINYLDMYLGIFVLSLWCLLFLIIIDWFENFTK